MQGVRPPLSGRSAALGIVLITFAVAWLRVGGRKDVLGVAKKTRAQVAAAGTKADSRREGHAGVQGQVARNGETAGAHKANAPGDRQSWWLPALDEESLSGREQLTKRIFTTVEVVLCLVLVGTVAVLSMAGSGLSAEGLQATFAENPAASITLIAACLQPFAAYLLRFVYRHYAQGGHGLCRVEPHRASVRRDAPAKHRGDCRYGRAALAHVEAWLRGPWRLACTSRHRRGARRYLRCPRGAGARRYLLLREHAPRRVADGRHLGRASAFGTLAK